VRVLLIRHGQSANNLLAESQGHDYAAYMAGRLPEPPLSEIGLRQAELLAQQLAAATSNPLAPSQRLGWVTTEHPIERIYVSPMLRAMQTALPISRALGLVPEVWVDIHEHGGVFTGNPELGNVVGYCGLTKAEMAEQFATYRVVDGVQESGWWLGGYEEMDVCYSRACRVAARLYALYEECEGSTIALVTHGTFLDALMHALFVPNEEYGNRIHFSHLNTAMSRVDIGKGQRVALRYHNRIDHLPKELVTR
jgi:2,3-bisphosphoglycerate-dependent phosphoglycerate mutase